MKGQDSLQWANLRGCLSCIWTAQRFIADTMGRGGGGLLQSLTHFTFQYKKLRLVSSVTLMIDLVTLILQEFGILNANSKGDRLFLYISKETVD